MDTSELLSILMVVALMTFLFSGYPVALVLIAVTMTFFGHWHHCRGNECPNDSRVPAADL
ncbi:MAG: hypothetical protein ABIL01_35005 [Pseudomonadota bacterium]